MKSSLLFFVLFISLHLVAQPYHYPHTKTVNVSDNYFGTVIHDPYRWLEDMKDTTVVAWFKQEADFTNNIFDHIPGVKTIASELTELSKIDSRNYKPLTLVNNTYFFLKRLPGEQVEKLYSRNGADGKDILLFDPANYIAGKVFIMDARINNDGSYLILNLSEAGKELGNIRIMDIKTQKILPEVIKNAQGEFSQSNPKAVFYTQFKNNDVNDHSNRLDTKFKIHLIGTDTSADKIVLSRKHDPGLGLKPADYPYVFDFAQSPYIFAMKSNVSTNTEMFYAPDSSLDKGKIEWRPFCKYADEIKQLQLVSEMAKSVVARGNTAYCLTTKGNAAGKIIKVDLRNPDLSNPPVILTGSEGWNIKSLMESKHYMIINMSKNGLESRNIKYDFETGQIKEIQLPLTGIVLVAPESTVSDECYIENTSWTQPMNFYQYDASTDKFSKGAFYSEIQYPGTENLTSKEVEVTSYDGVKVPLSLVYDKSKLKKDGSNICLMFGYGAYGMTMSPTYAYMMLPLLKRGGIAAFAHVRGGGEKGESWHLAGYKTTKPNTWKDFNACAEYLIKNQYTSSSKLGCTGASAGGILIGRAVTERPDLYKVAVPMVGCLNALRMENDANGPVNIPEFGTVKDSVECAALIKMDALHFVKKGTIYPAMLITTGFNDPRVASWIPGKFAAAMQADNAGNTPVLLYVNYKGGHFGGSTVNEMIHERAMETAFLLWQCGDPEFQMKR